jgi:hypothetical protein
MQQLYAYSIAEEDEAKGIALLEGALKYADNDKHRIDIYVYYQCAGELSYAYWCAGKQEKAVEVLSRCVSFVLSDLQGGTSKFAKSYLCICDCLIFKYEFDLKNKPLPKDQAVPYRGMFTEKTLTELDDLYNEDRIYTTSFQMSSICRQLDLKELSTEWAYKTVAACQSKKEIREMHYLLFLLLPSFIAQNDIETIKYVIAHSYKAKLLSYQKNLQLNKSNADLEFMILQVIPLLMNSLTMLLRGDNSGVELIKQVLGDYEPISDPEMIELVKAAFNRTSYNRDYIAEVNQLDRTRFYAVYLCAYLMTAFYSDAYYAFSLLVGCIPHLEKQLGQILDHDAIEIVNRFLADFWKARILQTPSDFVNYQRLRDRGLNLIDEYEGKDNQGNHTMFIVSHHLKIEPNLNLEQEKWLEE